LDKKFEKEIVLVDSPPISEEYNEYDQSYRDDLLQQADLMVGLSENVFA
jgi:hypothetical protein